MGEGRIAVQWTIPDQDEQIAKNPFIAFGLLRCQLPKLDVEFLRDAPHDRTVAHRFDRGQGPLDLLRQLRSRDRGSGEIPEKQECRRRILYVMIIHALDTARSPH